MMYYQKELEAFLDERNPASVFSTVTPFPCPGGAGIRHRFLHCLREDSLTGNLYGADKRIYHLMARDLGVPEGGTLTDRILSIHPAYRDFLPYAHQESLWTTAAESGNTHGLAVLAHHEVQDVVGEECALFQAIRRGRPGSVLFLLRESTSDQMMDAMEAAIALTNNALYPREQIVADRILTLVLLCFFTRHPKAAKLVDLYVEDLIPLTCGRIGARYLVDQILEDREITVNPLIEALISHVTGANADVAAGLICQLFDRDCARTLEGSPLLTDRDIRQMEEDHFRPDLTREQRYLWAKQIASIDGAQHRTALDGCRIMMLSYRLAHTFDQDAIVRLCSHLDVLTGEVIAFPWECCQLIISDRF